MNVLCKIIFFVFLALKTYRRKLDLTGGSSKESKTTNCGNIDLPLSKKPRTTYTEKRIIESNFPYLSYTELVDTYEYLSKSDISPGKSYLKICGCSKSNSFHLTFRDWY